MGLFFKKFMTSLRHSGADLFLCFLLRAAVMRSIRQKRNEPNVRRESLHGDRLMNASSKFLSVPTANRSLLASRRQSEMRQGLI
jgi:hypothetical protein